MPRPSGGRRRRLVWIVPALVALLLAAGAVKVLTGGPGDVSNPDVEFDTAPPAAPTTPQPKTTTSSAKDPFDDGFDVADLRLHRTTARATCRWTGRCARRSRCAGR